MTVDEIKTLIGAMAASDLTKLEVQRDGWTLRLARYPRATAPEPSQPAAPPRPADAPPAARPVSTSLPPAAGSGDITAPLSGIVHLSPAPGAPPFVSPGQAIEPGTLICTIEAMKTFNEVQAERGGILAAVLVTSGDEVETGQTLARLD